MEKMEDEDEDGRAFSCMDPTTVAIPKGNVNLLLPVFVS